MSDKPCPVRGCTERIPEDWYLCAADLLRVPPHVRFALARSDRLWRKHGRPGEWNLLEFHCYWAAREAEVARKVLTEYSKEDLLQAERQRRGLGGAA